MATDWIRKVGLSLTDAGGNQGQDLSELQIVFETGQASFQEHYPNRAAIRVWNPSESTAKRAMQEYQKVILQAGYENGDYGIIFSGTVKQIRKGRMNAKDSYLDIFAGDGDYAKMGLVNTNRAAGWGWKDYRDSISKAGKPYGVVVDETGKEADVNQQGLIPGLRGSAWYGLFYQQAHKYARTVDSKMTVENGKMIFTPLDGYRQGDIIELNSNTGLVNIPESTIEGLKAMCLLNPKIHPGQLVHINNKDITYTNVYDPYPSEIGVPPILAPVTEDGVYTVLVVEHVGDSRGHDWYTKLTCLSQNPSAKSVSAYGYHGVPAASGTDSASVPDFGSADPEGAPF